MVWRRVDGEDESADLVDFLQSGTSKALLLALYLLSPDHFTPGERGILVVVDPKLIATSATTARESLTQAQKVEVVQATLQREDPAVLETGEGLSSGEKVNLAVAMVRAVAGSGQRLASPMTAAIVHGKNSAPAWKRHFEKVTNSIFKAQAGRDLDTVSVTSSNAATQPAGPAPDMTAMMAAMQQMMQQTMSHMLSQQIRQQTTQETQRDQPAVMNNSMQAPSPIPLVTAPMSAPVAAQASTPAVTPSFPPPQAPPRLAPSQFWPNFWPVRLEREGGQTRRQSPSLTPIAEGVRQARRRKGLKKLRQTTGDSQW